jgi:Holliday junction DNA helicase RuvA
MIAHLNGIVAGIGLDGAVIEVGGVGLRVQCTPDTLATLKPGEPGRVATSLVVREDSLTLFGFATDDERNVFELLQTASGVGPRLALAMLAVHSPDALRRAVATEDIKALTMVPGVGNKGAQRIILEMKDRLGAPSDSGPGLGTGPSRRAAPSWRDQVSIGLVNLGWSARDAEAAITAVEADFDGQAPDVATALRAALRKLSKTLSSCPRGYDPPMPVRTGLIAKTATLSAPSAPAKVSWETNEGLPGDGPVLPTTTTSRFPGDDPLVLPDDHLPEGGILCPLIPATPWRGPRKPNWPAGLLAVTPGALARPIRRRSHRARTGGYGGASPRERTASSRRSPTETSRRSRARCGRSASTTSSARPASASR